MTALPTSRETAVECAERLSISMEAASLYADSEVVDLHVDSFIWNRLFGYDLTQYHGPGIAPGYFFRQADLPRLRRVGVDGATWVITTNPFRSARGRRTAFAHNLARLSSILEQSGQARVVGTYSEYVAARRDGLHAAFIGVQGGNALGPPFEVDAELARRLLRVTLVHLTNSSLGTTSSPLGGSRKASTHLGEFVGALNRHRIFVDLAHLSRVDFDRVLQVHSRDVPPIVTHTGICSACEHWRNLTTAQLRAIAERGGVVGIMYHSGYARVGMRRASARDIARHVVAALDVCGSDAVCLGSDWDGMITTPHDMPTCLELPRLVEELLLAGQPPAVVRKVLGGNFLRLLSEVRP